ncbi:MAG: hypothetical protein DRH15_10075 [Deltaproteobacteria bacterium]|nr:MAG: hypothetical protein DRH15_10075 [Deltaproteobacteria bacterium]
MDGENKDYHEDTVLELRPPELRQIKDYAVLIELGGEYLCEESILGKLADGIDQCLESLRDYVFRVRRRFVGKPLHEVDISGPFDGIEGLAKALRRPDEETKEKIKEGRIGASLMEATRQMADAVQELIERVQGKTDKYRKRDLLLQAYDKLKFFAHTLFTTYKYLTRILLCIAGACFIALLILFATMETEEEILGNSTQVKEIIEKKQDLLAKIEKDIAEVRYRAEILASRDEELGREEKIKLMELKLREHSLKQKKEKLEFEIGTQQKILDENLKKLEEIRKRSFFKRLLRIS